MSQRRDRLAIIDREAGLKGTILRPLSAKHMSPTIPEQSGLIDRERLYDFHGRSRKPQAALAAELGLVDYPQPAGGCLLTDPIYAGRLQKLLRESPSAKVRDINLLRVGRHFRLSETVSVIIGRDADDNIALGKLLSPEDYRFFVKNCGSPLATISGSPSEEDLITAAAITARYSAARAKASVAVTMEKDGCQSTLHVAPATDELVGRFRI
jgi:hypothetical protein